MIYTGYRDDYGTDQLYSHLSEMKTICAILACTVLTLGVKFKHSHSLMLKMKSQVIHGRESVLKYMFSMEDVHVGS